MKRSFSILVILILVTVCVVVPVSSKNRGEIKTNTVPNQVIFALNDIGSRTFGKINANDQSQLLTEVTSKHALNIADRFSIQGSNQTGYQELYLAEVSDVGEAVAAMTNDPRVAFAEPNYIYYPASLPNDEFVKNGNQINFFQAIHAPEAYEALTNTDIPIGISDTGVDIYHSDLTANIYTNLGEVPDNGIDDDSDGYIDDVHGYDVANNSSDVSEFFDLTHGTYVAGAAGAVGNNNLGVSGVAWQCKLVPIKFARLDASGKPFLDGFGAIKSMRYFMALLKGRPGVLNTSWGNFDFSQAMLDAVWALNSAKILLVAAAGNNAGNNDLSKKFYPASYSTFAPNVISVAAVDESIQELCSFSNFGAASVQIAAPGQADWTTAPNGGYLPAGGTSLAAPVVSGAAALIMGIVAKRNNLNPQIETKDILLNSVFKMNNLTGMVATGGILDLGRAMSLANGLSTVDAGGPYWQVQKTPVQFIANQTDPEKEAKSYFWDFGDGFSDIGRTPIHKYKKPGYYIVKLTIEQSGSVSVGYSSVTVTDQVAIQRAIVKRGTKLIVSALVSGVRHSDSVIMVLSYRNPRRIVAVTRDLAVAADGSCVLHIPDAARFLDLTVPDNIKVSIVTQYGASAESVLQIK